MWTAHYPLGTNNVIVTRLPAVSTLWGFVRPFVSESLRNGLLFVETDAQLLPTLTRLGAARFERATLASPMR